VGDWHACILPGLRRLYYIPDVCQSIHVLPSINFHSNHVFARHGASPQGPFLRSFYLISQLPLARLDAAVECSCITLINHQTARCIWRHFPRFRVIDWVSNLLQYSPPQPINKHYYRKFNYRSSDLSSHYIIECRSSETLLTSSTLNPPSRSLHPPHLHLITFHTP